MSTPPIVNNHRITLHSVYRFPRTQSNSCYSQSWGSAQRSAWPEASSFLCALTIPHHSKRTFICVHYESTCRLWIGIALCRGNNRPIAKPSYREWPLEHSQYHREDLDFLVVCEGVRAKPEPVVRLTDDDERQVSQARQIQKVSRVEEVRPHALWVCLCRTSGQTEDHWNTEIFR